MKCAIMQPTYLPWSGYFNLVASVDHFIFLDDVQYERQSWQARNRILVNGREHLLTVPTRRGGLETLINEVSISEAKDWRRSHWLTLKAAYQKAPNGELILSLLKPHLCDSREHMLSPFTEGIVRDLAAALGLQARFWRASDLSCQGVRSGHVASLCKALSCGVYLSPVGARQYLEEDNFSARFNINLQFQDFQPKPYKQFRASEFVSHLSIVDLIANQGLSGARAYLDNRRQQ